MADPKKRGYKWCQAVLDVDLEDQPVQEVYDNLSEIIASYGAEGWTDLRFIDPSWGDYGCNLEIWGFRPLTEEEKNAAKRKRERDRKKAEAQKLAKEEAERREYERLRLKFDPPAPLSKRTNVIDFDPGS